MKQIFIDTETTGLDPKKHAIWQVGAIFAIDGLLVDQIELTFQPNQYKEKSPGAMKMIQPEIKHLMDKNRLEPNQTAFQAFINWLNVCLTTDPIHEQLWFLAYNSKFDWDFISEWFKEQNNSSFKNYFYIPHICIQQMAVMHLSYKRCEMRSVSLSPIATKFNLVVESCLHHTALYDAHLAMQIFNKITMKPLHTQNIFKKAIS